MNVSSDDTLRGVRPNQIRVLLEVLRSNSWRKLAFVEERYRELAPNFASTLAFLQDLGWVRIEGTELSQVSAPIGNATPEGEAVALCEAIIASSGRHQRPFARYLAQFACIDGTVSCVPRGELFLADAPARDFLMELGAVRLDSATKVYVLEPAFIGAYLWAVAQTGPTRGIELLARQEDRQQLGLAAELVITAYERDRVGADWADQVRHVAGEHPASPYDIKSVTLGDRARPRYIEVKAVSPTDWEFHWSAAEIEIAKLIGNDFYLYLLPVRGPNDLDLAGLHIIANPFANVFSQPTAWEKRPTHFVCRPATAKTS